MTSYSVEFAKSGRSTCKKCKVKIEKGEIRIGATSNNGDDYDVTSWTHPKCFNVPRKLGCTVEEFVHEHLQDASEGGTILPDKAEELIEAIGSTTKKPAGAKKGGGAGGDSFIDKLKADYDAMNGGDDKKKKGSKKKRKADDSPGEESAKKKSKKNAAGGDSKQELALELYGKYHKMSVEQLKDYLRWNRQVLKGTKAVVLHKVIDGELRGRLPRCTICEGGTLKFSDDCTKIVCGGNFDEYTMQRIPCDIEYTFEDAPRAHPWYTEEPSEEEEKEMDRLVNLTKGIEEEDAEVDESSALGKLMKAALKIELDLSSKEAGKKSVAELCDLLADSDEKLDLPEEKKKLKVAVGKIVNENKDKDPPELVKMLVKHFGFVSEKTKKAAKKEKAASDKVVCQENVPLFLAFKELATLYFEEKNRNAGATYQKAASAIRDLNVVVTAGNAKAMGKAGKDKVANIGKSSAEKMYEFVTTGTMEKLEEKRANAQG